MINLVEYKMINCNQFYIIATFLTKKTLLYFTGVLLSNNKNIHNELTKDFKMDNKTVLFFQDKNEAYQKYLEQIKNYT